MINILLQDVAEISLGSSYARFVTNKSDQQAIKCELFTLQEFNEGLGIPYRLDTERERTLHLHEKDRDKLFFINDSTVLIHLLTQTALAVPKKYIGLLIPSNFVIIEFNDELNSNFFEWYFNEHPNIRRQIARHTQGAVISTLSISTLRKIQIKLPTMKKQKQIAKIYLLQSKKNYLLKEKQDLEVMFMNQTLLNQLEEK